MSELCSCKSKQTH